MQRGQPFELAIQDYFRHPDPMAMIARFADEPAGDHWRGDTVLVLPVFLALVLDASALAADLLVDRMRQAEAIKVEIAAQALNYSHHPGRRVLMERLAGPQAAEGMDQSGADFLALTPSHPVHVDMLWAAFFATGDTCYVDKIADLLAGWVPPSRQAQLIAQAKTNETMASQAMTAVLADTAAQGLARMAKSLAEVKARLYTLAARQDGMASALAAKIFAELEKG